MRCPTCQHPRTRIIRTRPDPENDATDHVRQCKSPSCLAIFNSRESIISVIADSADGNILLQLASRITGLSTGSREALFKLINAR